MPPPKAQLSRRSTANDSIVDVRPPPFWLWQVPCSTPAPDDDAGDLDGEHRPTLHRQTTRHYPAPCFWTGGWEYSAPVGKATLASPGGRQTGVGAARARRLVHCSAHGVLGWLGSFQSHTEKLGASLCTSLLVKLS
eukprot:scaffold5940_cov57-Phaeocystis_antarctica.AAC.1